MPDLTPLVAAIPTLGAVVKALHSYFGGDLERRTRRHTTLLADLPEGVRADELRALVDDELKELARRGGQRLHRKIDRNSVGGIVLVVIVGTAASMALWLFTPEWSTWLLMTMRVGAVLIALLSALLVMAGLDDLWTDARETKGSD